MNIKSLLIGSAAALAAVSGAQAADAIVAAEPEPMEYVRVCDAFGTGFFYIPGTETCLQIGGEVRFGLDFADDASAIAAGLSNWGGRSTSSWNAATRARLHFDARNDTEYGTLRSFIQLEATDDTTASSGSAGLRQAFIDIAGFRVGQFIGWWDDDIAGESDVLSNIVKYNSIRYTYDGGAFQAGLSLDELDGSVTSTTNAAVRLRGVTDTGANPRGHDVGVTGMVAAAVGGVNLQGLVGYDNAVEEWAARAIVTAEVGPGTFGLAGVWASDPNTYYNAAEWSVAASYAVKATEKLTLTPSVSYFGDVANGNGTAFTNVDAWGASLLAEYDVTTGLKASAAVIYLDTDAPNSDSEWGGFVRLTRSF